MRLLSGKVGVTSYAGLSTHRKQTPGLPAFLGLEEAEPNLGLPDNNNFVLYGTTEGERYWAAPSGAPSGSVEGIEVQQNEITPTGFAGSITKLNFRGNGVTVNQMKLDLGGGIEVGIATMTINRSTNDVMDASNFTRATGITTFKVGAGLSFFQEPGVTGIVSIFSAADARTNIQNADGTFGFGNVGTLRIGAGLTANQVSVGIASFGVTGEFEHINATGIVTSALGFKGDLAGAGVTASAGFYGNITGNVVGNVTGDVVGDVTGNVTGNLTGDFNSSGISTADQLFADTVQATGIITTSQGFVAPVGSFGFLGSLNSAGVSTVAFFNGTNINVSGITTSAGGFVAGIDGVGGTGFTGRLTGDVTGDINSSGVSTVSQLGATTVNASGIITASHFYGDGSNLSGIDATAIQDTNTQVQTAPLKTTITVNNTEVANFSQAGVKISGINTATTFSGSGSGLTNIPGGQITGALAAVDGSALTDVIADKVKLTATNTTAAEHFIPFVDTATGNEDVRTDVDLKWNPGTNVLTAATLSGNATGLTGVPNISVGDVTLNGNMLPDADATRNLGAAGTRWQNVFTADMHFSNVGNGGNSVDGSEGNWTLQEGKDDIFMINNLTGKKYKISLTPVS